MHFSIHGSRSPNMLTSMTIRSVINSQSTLSKTYKISKDNLFWKRPPWTFSLSIWTTNKSMILSRHLRISTKITADILNTRNLATPSKSLIWIWLQKRSTSSSRRLTMPTTARSTTVSSLQRPWMSQSSWPRKSWRPFSTRLTSMAPERSPNRISRMLSASTEERSPIRRSTTWWRSMI